MKTIKFISVLMLCSTLFISCTNNESDEEMQSLIDLQKIAEDGDAGEDPIVLSPPPPPPAE
ncbi:hypothetical protein MKD41_00185 [Lutibacter sp. A64]|uniref:hypothetical protein n=1 Tax=Lutibacter sp. A64 TaxID=2918526 RepID=UPI001F0598A9|nr:hypothetical protein [Lutibacter sp. A64]UMB53916.1 hypothetical protein MKD41_00185 [Lutibacter sp. A64]